MMVLFTTLMLVIFTVLLMMVVVCVTTVVGRTGSRNRFSSTQTKARCGMSLTSTSIGAATSILTDGCKGAHAT